jgi:hypothetical protein
MPGSAGKIFGNCVNEMKTKGLPYSVQSLNLCISEHATRQPVRHVRCVEQLSDPLS